MGTVSNCLKILKALLNFIATSTLISRTFLWWVTVNTETQNLSLFRKKKNLFGVLPQGGTSIICPFPQMLGNIIGKEKDIISCGLGGHG